MRKRDPLETMVPPHGNRPGDRLSEVRRRQRSRAVAMALALAGFVVLLYAITIVRMGAL